MKARADAPTMARHDRDPWHLRPPRQDALICAFAFAPGSAPQPIETLGAVPDAFERHCGGFVWVHVNLEHTGAQPWLERHAGVGPVFFEALTEGSRSTRIECDGDMLFGVMNDVTFDFSFDPSDVATLWMASRRTS